MTTLRRLALFLLATAALSAPAWAGMSPNPITFRVDQLLRYRVEALSFFTVVTLVLAGVVMAIWNALRKDFPRLPRLTFWRSLGLVFLWGLLIAVVLSMITGARELMTPGAWERSGATYRVAPPPAPEQLLTARREQLEHLKSSLWDYASAHNNLFPSHEWMPEVPKANWIVPSTKELRYIYVPRVKIDDHNGVVLAYEPDVFDDERFVLMTDGQIVRLRDDEIVSRFTVPWKGSEATAATSPTTRSAN